MRDSIDRMNEETNGLGFARLARAIGRLSTKLEANDLRPVYTALAERIKVERSNGPLILLGDALAAC